jgi:hypothetical protein
MVCSRLNFAFTEPAWNISSTIERQRKRKRKTGKRNKE